MLKAGGNAVTVFPWHHKPLIFSSIHTNYYSFSCTSTGNNSKVIRGRLSHTNNPAGGIIKASAAQQAAAKTTPESSVTVKVVATVQVISAGLVYGNTLQLELAAAELDPKTGTHKERVKGYLHKTGEDEDEVMYESDDFVIPHEFGKIGAVLVENEHDKEMYLKQISIHGLPNGTLNITCNSWVHSKSDNPRKRIFFTSKSYLPLETPSGVQTLREEELEVLRGDGFGERKSFERIYDYDVYNDLGDPDTSKDLKRLVLGGKEHPYPRRCRTGRTRSKKDPQSESMSSTVYVPRDEEFSEVKNSTFSANGLYSSLHALLPFLEAHKDNRFPYFTSIDKLFDKEVDPILFGIEGILNDALRLLLKINDSPKNVLLFETPDMILRDKFSWVQDDEFARQTLAGLNPYSIRLVTEWPLKSKLHPKVYGPPESAITKDIIEKGIRGDMTVEEAVLKKKLFILDYHDLLLPYVNKVREIEGSVLYGSRTIFFLTPTGILRPLAIELTRPPGNGKPQWKQVFTPCEGATAKWLWRLAKAHVRAHDSSYHQLVSHWLRTHCCMEPYIIATNRQLSAMHPIYRLLHPHLRYTMKINALARTRLINAGGIIESCFTPRKYSIEISSVAYDLQWQFDLQALPADLISRGMAVEDLSAPHGVKLAIEDYPFANDGLILWDIIKEWVTNYVKHYYPDASTVKDDQEIQAWWTEIKTVGHRDKKDEPGWPNLNTPNDLIGILTTMIWVASGQHAAVNFGQYNYAAYFPNWPTIARTKMPTEDRTDEKWKHFIERPEDVLLSCLPSKMQATTVMAVLDLLSNHSPDEEYIGNKTEPSWAEDHVINVAFEIFNGKLKQLEGIIDARNADENLKNRNGAGVVPYELLKPVSKPGVTSMGVPNSISI